MPVLLIKASSIKTAAHIPYHLVPKRYCLQLLAIFITTPHHLSLHLIFIYFHDFSYVHKFSLDSPNHTSLWLAELKAQNSFLWVEKWGMKKRGERWRDYNHLWFNIVSVYPCYTFKNLYKYIPVLIENRSEIWIYTIITSRYRKKKNNPPS